MANLTNEDWDYDSEDVEEEIEPRLKYTKLMKLRNVLNGVAKCIAVHQKFICLGTNSGTVHVLDHSGECVAGHDSIKCDVAVNQISVDRNGDFLTILGINGNLSVYNLKANKMEKIERSGICAAAMDSNLNGCFIIKGPQFLTLCENSGSNDWMDTYLCEITTPVTSFCWGTNFIAWSTNIGVDVYNSCAKQSLNLIKWHDHSNVSPDNFKCSLRWADAETLLIAWMDVVWIYTITKKCDAVKPSIINPVLVSKFQTHFYISGIAAFGDQLILLGFPSDEKQVHPHLYVLEYNRNDYTEICADCLTIRGDQLNCNDCHLDVLSENDKFYVLTPNDVVIASPYGLEDRIQWLVERNKFDVALNLARKEDGNVEFVGGAYLDHLLASGAYAEAAKLCTDIFVNNKKILEEQIVKFAKVNQLRSVSRYIPSSLEHKLELRIYEMVLNEFLELDFEGFLKLVKEWNPGLYNVEFMINATLDRMIVSDNKMVYCEAMAILYSYDRQYDKSVQMYLKIKHKDVFKLIRQHNLHRLVEKFKDELLEMDAEETTTLLLEKKNLSHK